MTNKPKEAKAVHVIVFLALALLIVIFIVVMETGGREQTYTSVNESKQVSEESTESSPGPVATPDEKPKTSEREYKDFAPEFVVSKSDLDEIELNNRKIKSKIGGGPGGISGKINQEAVYSVIRRRMGGVRYCYESQLKKIPNLKGKVRVKFFINTFGEVSHCSIIPSSMNNKFVTDCVCRMVLRWSFPAPDEGIVSVGYTFIFSPG